MFNAQCTMHNAQHLITSRIYLHEMNIRMTMHKFGTTRLICISGKTEEQIYNNPKVRGLEYLLYPDNMNIRMI